MASDSLLIALDRGVMTLTLNRPSKRNALDTPTLAALEDALLNAELDAGVRVVALRGAGKDFCAGADLDELLASADRTMDENEAAALRMGGVFVRIRQLPKPVVAVVHGRVLAGGCGLATACDLVLAPASAVFGYPEIQRGFVPAMVMTMLRRAVGEKVAFDLAATGRILTAAEAAAAGPGVAGRSRVRLRAREPRGPHRTGRGQRLRPGAHQAAVLPARRACRSRRESASAPR